MPWELDEKAPIYQQLIEVLQLRILTGYYKAGQRLPSVRDLAQEAAVNPNTMQRALSELEGSGLVLTHRTRGRVITSDQQLIDGIRKKRAMAYTKAYLTYMAALGYDQTSTIQWIKTNEEEAP